MLMVLDWIRNYPSYYSLGATYGISSSTVCKEINHIVPLLMETLNDMNIIKWPDSFKEGFEGSVGAIDCSSHFRNRVHPGQANYFRHDKAAFFLTVHAVTGLDGCIYSVCIGLGHNNDKGMLILSGMKSILQSQKFKLLADGGYSLRLFLITPQEILSPEWNRQKAARSVVEVIFSHIHAWKAADINFKQCPETQAMVLMTIYQLEALKLLQFPLRVVN